MSLGLLGELERSPRHPALGRLESIGITKLQDLADRDPDQLVHQVKHRRRQTHLAPASGHPSDDQPHRRSARRVPCPHQWLAARETPLSTGELPGSDPSVDLLGGETRKWHLLSYASSSHRRP
jgi:hypothetical protein